MTTKFESWADDRDLRGVIRHYAMLGWEASQPKWMPIESAPDQEEVLLYISNPPFGDKPRQAIGGCFTENGKKYSTCAGATHWHPKLEPPKQ